MRTATEIENIYDLGHISADVCSGIGGRTKLLKPVDREGGKRVPEGSVGWNPWQSKVLAHRPIGFCGSDVDRPARIPQSQFVRSASTEGMEIVTGDGLAQDSRWSDRARRDGTTPIR